MWKAVVDDVGDSPSTPEVLACSFRSTDIYSMWFDVHILQKQGYKSLIFPASLQEVFYLVLKINLKYSHLLFNVDSYPVFQKKFRIC